jgi:hypothetical protein
VVSEEEYLVVRVVVVSNWYVVVAVATDLMPLPLSCDWLQIVQMTLTNHPTLTLTLALTQP